MNPDIITITARPDGIRTINARELHTELAVGKDFATWIKDRIAKYDFEEGSDFTVESRSPELGSGNRGAAIDYHITLAMAKEIAMVERTPQGKFWRQYFIRVEKLYLGGARALPGAAAAAAPASALPAAVQEHIDAVMALKLTGMTANQASRAILKVTPPPVRAAHTPLASCSRITEEDIQELLQVMQPECSYTCEQLAAAMPRGHRLRGGTDKSNDSAVGMIMGQAVEEGRAIRIKPRGGKNRRVLYQLPAIALFTAEPEPQDGQDRQDGQDAQSN